MSMRTERTARRLTVRISHAPFDQMPRHALRICGKTVLRRIRLTTFFKHQSMLTDGETAFYL